MSSVIKWLICCTPTKNRLHKIITLLLALSDIAKKRELSKKKLSVRRVRPFGWRPLLFTVFKSNIQCIKWRRHLNFFSKGHKRNATAVLEMLQLLWEKANYQTSNNVVFIIKFGFEKICNVFKSLEWQTRRFDPRAQFQQLKWLTHRHKNSDGAHKWYK